MSIEKITVLGLSEAFLTMLFDILESNNDYYEINIINNLNINATKEYLRPTFKISETNDVKNITDKVVIGAAVNKTRFKIRNSFKEINDENFITLINKNCDISNTTRIGVGVIINGLVCIAGHTTIGDFVFINRGCTIGHHTSIGKFVTINPGVNIAGNVIIGEHTQIGLGASIIDGITIGSNTIIGAGSVVTKNIPDNVIAYGNPCKIIRHNE
jgi:sugar O-acyltransferase (sialic acid O-acetyltransferase NeuD family)